MYFAPCTQPVCGSLSFYLTALHPISWTEDISPKIISSDPSIYDIKCFLVLLLFLPLLRRVSHSTHAGTFEELNSLVDTHSARIEGREVQSTFLWIQVKGFMYGIG